MQRRFQVGVLLSIATLLLLTAVSEIQGRSFGIDYDNNTFVKDGKPFRYISGSIHYSRVPYQYWDDRLKKMAAAGLNAIQTYVPWNVHETEEGQFNFTGQQDIVTFLKLAQKYNLVVILRPGPYICAEWEFGGLPAWLMKYPDIRVRSSDPKFIGPVDRWFTRLFTELKPMMYKNGGPIISVQVENEYGSYFECDYDYLVFLREKMAGMVGDDVVFFSTDGDGAGYLKCGAIPDIMYATVDFGVTYNPEKNFESQRAVEPKGPLVNSEFYTGWLDHWGENHSTTPTSAVAKSLDLILALGANVNMYMFEGGTNFGFWSGAEDPSFKAIPTSYDYNAPLTEAGDITNKYHAIRNVIEKYNPPPKMKIPPSTPKFAYGRVQLTFVETLLDYVKKDKPVSARYPLNMEALNHYYGFILYKHVLTKDVKDAVLKVPGIRDRGYISVGPDNAPVPVGVVQRDSTVQVTLTGSHGDSLYILVENQGRVNYGSQMNDNRKGLISNVTLDGTNLTDWLHIPVQSSDNFKPRGLASNVGSSRVAPAAGSGYELPALYQGSWSIDKEPEDTYIDMSLWTKGQIFINGQNLGRYWPHVGPQVRLYVPKFWLQKGPNTVILLELEKSPCSNTSSCYVEFMDQPLINSTVTPISDKSKQTDYDIFKGSERFRHGQIRNDDQKSCADEHSFFKSFFRFLFSFVEKLWNLVVL